MATPCLLQRSTVISCQGQIQYFQFTGTNADGIGQLVGTAGSAAAQLAATNTGSTSASGISVIPGPITTPPLLAEGGGVQASSPTPGETNLTQNQLDSVVAAAIAEWASAGASASQLAALHAVTFSVADLPGNVIGEETLAPTKSRSIPTRPDMAGTSIRRRGTILNSRTPRMPPAPTC